MVFKLYGYAKFKYTVYYHTIEKTKITEKFQVTIPKKVREKIDLKPGEIMIVEAKGENEIRLKRFRKIKNMEKQYFLWNKRNSICG